MRSHPHSTDSQPTEARPALVLQRWNSWVRVYLPESGELRWVDLREARYEPLPVEPFDALEAQAQAAGDSGSPAL